MKQKVIDVIREDLGKVDLVIYSIAAPRRTAPDGVTYRSVLKTTGEAYTNRTIDLLTNQLTEATIEPASQQEISDTIKVMGGEDWMLWMQALKEADVLAEGAGTVAYSYIGPEMTHPIYKEGSIGQAKKDLYKTADRIQDAIPGVAAYVAVNKAVVTQSSAAIPIVPLYLAILFRVMKEQKLHENCIQQMYRLIHDRLYNGGPVPTDEDRLIRMDDWEMKPEVQQAVLEVWNTITQDNLEQVTDITGYWKEFYEIFGFEVEGVDYDADVETGVEIPSLT
jgi:enoyl-[acyl-carrier protein] reductase/trans-2-enoyl-CoA reductase (NAD+)